MTEREVLKLALEALVEMTPSGPNGSAIWHKQMSAITAASEALAQPEYQSTADKSKLEKVPAKGTLLAQPEQARPQNCGTGYCSCIECVMEPEPVAWKQGGLVTLNRDPYPSLGEWFVQFWEGEDVAARVYGNDHETLNRRCAMLTTPPQRTWVGLTDDDLRQIILVAIGVAEAKLKEKNT